MTLQQAIALHQHGRVAEAEAAYEEILRERPHHAAALHLLGVLLMNTARYARAAEVLVRAVAANPDDIAAQANLATSLQGAGRYADALAACDALLARKPDHAEALLRRADALLALRRFDDAAAAYERYVAVVPNNPAAYISLATALSGAKKIDACLARYAQAIALDPANATAYNNRANELHRLGRFAEALDDAQRAVAARGDFKEAHANVGRSALKLRQFEVARTAFERALSLAPRDGAQHRNLAVTLHYLGDIATALAHFDEALRLDAADAQSRVGRAICLLSIGETARGLEDFEARKQLPEPLGVLVTPRPELQPGEPIAGRKLLVHAEQGLGDTIQLMRYIPALEAMGANVTLSLTDILHALARTVSPTVTITNRPYEVDFDVHCAMFSLPWVFGEVAVEPPYLHADPVRVAAWRKRIGQNGFRIGVSWHSKKEYENGRSFPLARLQGIAALPGVRLISLQAFDGLEQLRTLPDGMVVEDLGADFDAGHQAFLDTAAVMDSLDLVIACDSAVAHLAGALARPCWLAQVHIADWRWGLRGTTSALYPTLRQFRQPRHEDWESVFAEMEAALRAHLVTLA